MAERLSMSLDDIISKKQAESKRPNKSRPRIAKSSNRTMGKIRVSHTPKKFHEASDGGIEGGDEYVPPAKPMKVISIERPRPKVILPGQQQAPTRSAGPSSSSVFDRLGGPSVCVVFSNLQRTVEKGDVTELCNAVGAVRQVAMELDSQGLGVARVTFAQEQDASYCVAKYNGVALDGLAMVVSIDKSAPKSSTGSVFGRLQANPSVLMSFTVSNKADSNVREGLFGTALPSYSTASSFRDKPQGRVVLEERILSRPSNAKQYRSGGGGAGRGYRGDGSNPRSSNRQKPSSHEDMDADLDTYMTQR